MYSFKIVKGNWDMYHFVGPGIPQYANSLYAINKCAEKEPERAQYDVDTIIRFLALAFEAGKKAKAEEVKDVLGIYP